MEQEIITLMDHMSLLPFFNRVLSLISILSMVDSYLTFFFLFGHCIVRLLINPLVPSIVFLIPSFPFAI
jgi:hypothetical protein